MTKEEFWKEYKKLADKYPHHYSVLPSMKLTLFYDMVKSFDVRWMIKNVYRVLNQNDPNFDWKYAAAAEIKAINSIARTDALLRENSDVSDDGLERALGPLGLKSLVDCLKSHNDTLDND